MTHASGEQAEIFERFVGETLAIAQRGERRAASLESVAWTLVAVAVLVSIGTAAVAAGTSDALTDGQRAAIVALGLGAVISLIVSTAIFLGFAALVRNSSRTLELLTLDSSLLD